MRLSILKFTGTLALVLVLVFLVLSFTGRKTFRVETKVAASPDAVWAVLTDAKGYPDWNPVFVEVDGVFEEGASVTTTVREPGKADVKLSGTVISVVPRREIHQRLGVPLIITSDHRWLLEPEGDGTRIIQDEVDVGFMVWFWESNWVEAAYQSANEALGNHALTLESN